MISEKNLLKSFVGLLVIVVVLFFGFQDYASASTSNFHKAINFQSKLTDDEGNIVPDGEYNVRFKLYDTSTGGVALWTELCIDDNRVQITNGLFSHYLGSITPFDDFDFNRPLWLGVEIGGSGDSPDWDGEMTPRKKIGAVPAAFEADKLDGIDSEQFLRSDEPDTMNASSSNILLTVQQDGSGNIVNFKVGDSSKLLIDNNGRVGIGTDTPSDKLTIFDGSVFQGMPVNPTVVGGDNLYFSSAPKAIYVSGKYAYVGCYDNSGVNGFRIIDVSEPTNPAVIGGENLSLPDEVSSIHVSGRYAYMGFKSYGTDAFRIIDVSDPANPTVVGGENLNLPGNAKFIDVSGRYAYIGLSNDGTNAFRIIDVSDPTNPVVVGGENLGFPDLDYPDYIGITSLYVSGRYAYLGLCRADSTSSFGSLMIIDVFNPASPIIIGEELILPQTAQSIYVSGRYAYMGLGEYDAESGTDLFRIIDVSDPANPTVVGGESLNLPGRVKFIDVSGRYVYIGIGKSDTEPGANSFRIIDVSDPTNPTVVGGENLSLPNWARSIHVSGRYAYMGFMGCCDDDPEGTSFNAFRIIDITGIEAVSVVANSLEAGNLQVRNDILAQGELQISGSANIGSGLQVTGPVSVFGGSTSTPFMPFVIDHNGYVGIGTNAPSDKLTIYDGSVFQGMPFNPTIVGGENLELPTNPKAIYISGKYAYVGFKGDFHPTTDVFRIIDISNPTNPTIVGGEELELGGSVISLYVSGKYAYVVLCPDTAERLLKIIDISNPSNPTVVGGVGYSGGLSTSLWTISVSGRYAYVGSSAGPDSFRIVDVSDPTNPIVVGGDSLILPGPIKSLDVSGRYAYGVFMDSGTDAFRIIDVSDPTNPIVVGGDSLNLPATAKAVSVSGRYAYILFSGNCATPEQTDGFRIIDISDPTNPTVVGGGSLSLPNCGRSLYVSGRYAYGIFNDDTEDITSLRIIDVFDPANPVVVGGENLILPFSEVIGSLFVSGKYAYVLFCEDGRYGNIGTDVFRIIDITGIEAVSVVANSLEAGNLQVRNDILAQGELQISGSVNIGSGLQVTGPVSIFGGSTSSAPFVIDRNGNIGIGTTMPDSRLSIQSSGVSTATTSALHIQNASSTSMLFVRDDGNIGVGTNAPSETLDVSGTFKVGLNGLLDTDFSGATTSNTIVGNGEVSLAYETRQWTTTTIESPYAGNENSISAVDDDNVFISYSFYDGENDYLSFASSNDGGSNWTTTTIDGPFGFEPPNSISAVDNNNVFISYTSHEGGDTYLSFASSNDGGSSWTTTTVDGPFIDIFPNSISAVDADNVFISYSFYDGENDYLGFASSNDSGSSWTTTTIDSSSGDYMHIHSISAVDSDNVFISYSMINSFDMTSLGLYLASSDDGGSSWTTTTVDSSSGASMSLSISAVDADNIFISYLLIEGETASSFNLASSSDGGSSWTTTTIDGSFTAGAPNSISAVDENNIFISYSTDYSTYLNVALSNDGGSSWVTTTIDFIFDGGSPENKIFSISAVNTDDVFISYFSDDYAMNFAKLEVTYYSSGTITSAVQSTNNTDWGIINWTDSTDADTNITMKVRTDSNSDMSGATDWSSCSTISKGSDISSNSCVTDGEPYIQYQATLTTSDTSEAPILYDVTINSPSLFVDASGNISVGKSTAIQTLSVYGDAILEGANRYLNFGIIADDSGYGIRDNDGSIEFKNEGGEWMAMSSGGGSDSDWIINESYMYSTSTVDYVGIGTSTPLSTLTIQSSGVSTTTSALHVQSASGTSMLFVRDDGRVVVATTTPEINAMLTVTGGTTGVYGYGYGEAPMWEGTAYGYLGKVDTDNTKTYGVYGFATEEEFHPSSAYGVYGEGLTAGLYGKGGELWIGETLIHYGLAGLFEGEVRIEGTSTESLLTVWSSSSDSVLYVNNTGHLGIGTTTPDSRLGIQGFGSSTSSSSLHIQNASGTSMLFVRDDGRVVAGTTTPETNAMLTVTGGTTGVYGYGYGEEEGWEGTAYGYLGKVDTDDTKAYGVYGLAMESEVAADSSYGVYGEGLTAGIYGKGGEYLFMGSPTGEYSLAGKFEGELRIGGIGDESLLTVWSSSSDSVLYVDNTGHLGIGTTTTDSRLGIQGFGSSTSSSSLHIQNASGTSVIFVRDDGNIGIGTSSPETLFHIEGTTTAQNIVPRGDAIYNLGSAEQRWNNLYTATTSVGDLLFSNDFRIIEATNSPESLIILNQNGEKIAELDETGNFWAKRLTIEESTNGQIVDISSEQLKISLASLGLIISEDGNLETEKIRTKGIELIDKATGEIYCTWIENGEWQKEKGECGTLYESEEENNILGGGGEDMNEGGNESENTEENGEGIEGESVNEDESEGESESENGEGDNEEGEGGEGEEEEEGAIDQAEESESGSESESEEESGSEGEEESGDEGGEEVGGENESGEELGEEGEGEDGEVPEEEIGSESNGDNDGESEESEITNQPEESEEDVL